MALAQTGCWNTSPTVALMRKPRLWRANLRRASTFQLCLFFHRRQRHHQPVDQLTPTKLPKKDFLRAWCSVSYLHPGLHPDGFAEADSGWPRTLKPFASEAWRRAGNGELADEELYPCDAQWSGLYDRLTSPTPEETTRRMELKG